MEYKPAKQVDLLFKFQGMSQITARLDSDNPDIMTLEANDLAVHVVCQKRTSAMTRRIDVSVPLAQVQRIVWEIVDSQPDRKPAVVREVKADFVGPTKPGPVQPATDPVRDLKDAIKEDEARKHAGVPRRGPGRPRKDPGS